MATHISHHTKMVFLDASQTAQWRNTLFRDQLLEKLQEEANSAQCRTVVRSRSQPSIHIELRPQDGAAVIDKPAALPALASEQSPRAHQTVVTVEPTPEPAREPEVVPAACDCHGWEWPNQTPRTGHHPTCANFVPVVDGKIYELVNLVTGEAMRYAYPDEVTLSQRIALDDGVGQFDIEGTPCYVRMVG